jgi:hypothetical protein
VELFVVRGQIRVVEPVTSRVTALEQRDARQHRHGAEAPRERQQHAGPPRGLEGWRANRGALEFLRVALGMPSLDLGQARIRPPPPRDALHRGQAAEQGRAVHLLAPVLHMAAMAEPRAVAGRRAGWRVAAAWGSAPSRDARRIARVGGWGGGQRFRTGHDVAPA